MDTNLLPSLKEIIASHDLLARKSLGQHFLLDSRITDKIVRYAGDVSACQVIEIGPGPGGLTRSLLAAGAAHLWVVEKDDRCIAIMEALQHAAPGRLTILHDDAMAVNLIDAVPAPRKIVANLPYNIGTALLLQWLDAIYTQGPHAFNSLTLMFQKEVAERIVAAPGNKDFGRLSVLCQWLCECRYDMELPPGAFSPPPKVSSAVVTLIPRATPVVQVEKRYLERLLAAAFGQRRKMLRSALKSLGADTERLLAEANIDGTKRAEQLDVITLCELGRVFESAMRNR